MNSLHLSQESRRLGLGVNAVANWRRRAKQAAIIAVASIAVTAQTALAGVILSGGGLTLLEEGGSFADNNLATMGSATPMAIDEWQADPVGYHRIVHLNDGLYGNEHSWIGWAGTNVHGVAFAGISLGAVAVPDVYAFAFGRDNRPGGLPDRTLGHLFTLQYTRVSDPHTNLDLPDDTTVAGTTATTGWATIGTLDYQSAGGAKFNVPSRRHLYGFDPLDATGIRLIVPIGDGGTRPAIDEIELYGGPEFRNLDFEDAVITLEPPEQDPGLPLSVLASDALPHWTTNGLVPSPNTILYNFTCLGPGCTSIHDDDSFFTPPPLQGNYTVHLTGPADPPGTGPLYISQVGRVPSTATRLSVLVNSAGGDVFDVSFDDGSGSESLGLLTPFPRGRTVRLLYDVAEFSGDIGELKISSSSDFQSWVFIDDLRFVPEPSTLLLVALASAGLLLRTRRKANALPVPLNGNCGALCSKSSQGRLRMATGALALVGVALCGGAAAEAPPLKWIRQLGTSSFDGSYGVSSDGFGSVYIAGSTEGSLGGTSAGSDDAFLSKYDSRGWLQWTRQLGTSSEDGSYGVAADGLGNVYVSGRTYGSLGGINAGNGDAFVSKYNYRGMLEWTRQLGTESEDWSYGVSADGLGGVYITGPTYGSLGGTNAGGPDAFVGKYNSSGILLWARQLGTGDTDFGTGVSEDQWGNVYISGNTWGGLGGTNAGLADVFVAKFVPEPSALLLAALASVGLLLGRSH